MTLAAEDPAQWVKMAMWWVVLVIVLALAVVWLCATAMARKYPDLSEEMFSEVFLAAALIAAMLVAGAALDLGPP